MDDLSTDNFIVGFIIPLYVRNYVRSNSTRAKYIKKPKPNKELQKKYQDTTKYGWKHFTVVQDNKKILREFLIDLQTNEKVVSNASHVGAKNIKNINGQDIYNGNVAQHDRNKLMGVIHSQFKSIIKHITPITRFPIRIDVYLHDTIIDTEFSNGQDWDMDNRFFPYGKALADVLKKEKIIPEDNRYYITEPPHAIFVPVEDTEDRKLEVIIYQDTRKVIADNFLYKRFHTKV